MEKQQLQYNLKKSSVNLARQNDLELVRTNINFALEGEKPRLIDEWQVLPKLWDEIRLAVDESQDKGLFILTGSSTPVDSEQIYHSGAGRNVSLKMRPMSLYESQNSKGLVSIFNLANLKNDFNYTNENKEHKMDDLLFYLCRGGWPASVMNWIVKKVCRLLPIILIKHTIFNILKLISLKILKILFLELV
ncbi:AAA family ATPase [[Mycoplasma] testudinis]|uniref:AAA family ATPase n=1 Tax=[Mycoplasma] testudinis TaxID=33924 RepID=UPI0006967C06|nr:AAA family ATPase [[Mycoplasma] testudinis]